MRSQAIESVHMSEKVEGSVFRNWWTSKPVWEKIFFASLAIIVIVIVAYFAIGVVVYGGSPVLGHSMEPTLSSLSGLVFPDYSRKKPEVNDIVKITRPDKSFIYACIISTDIKRVSQIRQDGAIKVLSDNGGVTGEDSIDYGWLHSDRVVFVAEDIFSPTRWWREHFGSDLERKLNKLQFELPVKRIHPNLDSGYIVVDYDEEIVIVTNNDEYRIEGNYATWNPNTNTVRFTRPSRPNYLHVYTYYIKKGVIQYDGEDMLIPPTA